MRTSHLNALRALEATLRNGSFAAAAEELGVTPAAVGQQVRHLEGYVGCELFERRPAGAVALPATRRVDARLTSAFSALSDVLDELGRRRPANRIAVTLPESFAENWFVPRLSSFYRDNGGVDLRLDSTNRRVDLMVEDFDFAIRYSPPPPAALRAEDMFGDWVLPVCSPAFAEEHGLGCARPSLAGVPLIHLRDRTPDLDWADWPRWSAAFGFDPTGLATGPSLSRFSSGVQAALAGQALVLCGLVEAWHVLSRGALIAPFGAEKRLQTGYRYRLVSVGQRPRSPVQQRFRRWILETACAFRADMDKFTGSVASSG